MTLAECMTSNSPDAIRVREILKRQDEIKWPDDSILYQILYSTTGKRLL